MANIVSITLNVNGNASDGMQRITTRFLANFTRTIMEIPKINIVCKLYASHVV